MTRHSSIFVCGTDTGVGKTIVTGALCAYLNDCGIRSGAFKPLESGCKPADGMKRHLERADSEFLKKMAGMGEPLDTINPYNFEEALAPGVAAERKNQKITFKKIKNNLCELRKKYKVIFIEGAGGLLVPINHLKTNLDLIRELRIPVLVVARLGLGTINHTLLTLNCLQHHKIQVLGVILNETTPEKNLAEETNPGILKKYRVPLLGIFPHLEIINRHLLIQALKKNLNLTFMLEI